MNTGKRLMHYVKPYWRQLTVGFVTMVFMSAIQLVYPVIMGPGLIDRVLNTKDFRMLNWLVLLVIVAVSIKACLTFAQNYFMAFVGQRVVANLRNAVFHHLQKMSIAFHESHRVGEIISRVTNDVALIQMSVSVNFIDLIYQGFSLLGSLVAVFVLSWRLALLTLITFPIVVLVVSVASKKIRAISYNVQETIANLTAILQESLSGIRIVKAFTMEEHEVKRFAKENETSFRATMKSVRATSILNPTVELLFIIGLAVVLWYGGSEVIHGHLTTGSLVAFFAYILMAISPLTGITHNLNSIQQALAAADRVFETLDYEADIQDAPNAVAIPKIKGKIEFRDVRFSYQNDVPVLEHIQLTVNPGEIVALVGPSGAGKTSLVNLIPRFYDPTEGQVLVDDHDIRSVQMKSLREQIGLVPQESILFGVSIRENIGYGKPGATEEEIVAAAKAANAHDFILNLSEGYATKVGERGASLSGGQRQRIAIARALLRNPRILILDEATSALDTESERLVQEALERLMRDRTTFVIAHRLSTVKFAHKIIVLAEGRIVEVGTHEELLAMGGLYQRLYEAGSVQSETDGSLKSNA